MVTNTFLLQKRTKTKVSYGVKVNGTFRRDLYIICVFT